MLSQASKKIVRRCFTTRMSLSAASDLARHLQVSAPFSGLSIAKLAKKYVPSCNSCQRMQVRTTTRAGKLHSVPVPPQAFSDIALDQAGLLLPPERRDMLLTTKDRLTGYTSLLACCQRTGQRRWRSWLIKDDPLFLVSGAPGLQPRQSLVDGNIGLGKQRGWWGFGYGSRQGLRQGQDRLRELAQCTLDRELQASGKVKTG